MFSWKIQIDWGNQCGMLEKSHTVVTIFEIPWKFCRFPLKMYQCKMYKSNINDSKNIIIYIWFFFFFFMRFRIPDSVHAVRNQQLGVFAKQSWVFGIGTTKKSVMDNFVFEILDDRQYGVGFVNIKYDDILKCMCINLINKQANKIIIFNNIFFINLGM